MTAPVSTDAVPTTGQLRQALPLVSVRNLEVAYTGEPVLAGVDLDVRPGEMVALLAPQARASRP
ncbi:ABC-type phosphate/phosphonate transport system, ATPase component [Arthrobacter nitrophenolicus]|uniref:ABC-type phosphate/phosphonate transport system, ATPase component n=1 Tax=Arthrobacter nitrophenolicus TaxID=683150 RepID=L8TQA6_9MICC|nr:ABC-type phosphate/phosphonate transport system, ATPase component [Arthrobacter nitrophenolicus]ELT43871.1 ABC-type phosphate/phosphonate transport system, ATPase component [Arthrobacter nitrophenolicus]